MKTCKAVAPEIQARLKTLEDAGFTITLRHLQNRVPRHHGSGAISDGETIMVLRAPEVMGSELSALGIAYCSVKDQYSKARGTEVAFNKAIHDLSHQIGRSSVRALMTGSTLSVAFAAWRNWNAG